MLFVICLTIVTSFLVGFGISVSKDVCILMLFIQILFGLLLAIQRLVMFIVVVETLLWVQFFLKSKMDIFIIVIWIFCDLFCLTCEVIFWPIIWFSSYTWQICILERVFCLARGNNQSFNWLCMMIAYGWHQQTHQFTDGLLKYATHRRFSKEGILF
jgi:hypothetical protein